MKTEWEKLVEEAGSEEELLRIMRLPEVFEKLKEVLLKVGKNNSIKSCIQLTKGVSLGINN